MTYGENAGAIRDELTVLLSYHRIQQRIGGNGIHTVPATTTAAEREVVGQVIRRYRHAVLVWCSQALRAVSVKAEPVARRTPHQSPVNELRLCLGYAAAGGPAEPRLVDLLATDHAFELVARWQRAARAAALGEHDFTADVNRGSLNDPQLHTVVGDVATVVRALGVLDTRYAYIPGWRPLPRHPRLMQAAADVSSAVAADGADASVDARGWQPQPTLSSASRDAGLAGAAAAQHNVVIELGRFPTALNLRRVMHLQAQVSALAARHARGGAPDLAARFEERAMVYRQLVVQARNLGGLVGAGAGAVCASHASLKCLRFAAVIEGFPRDKLEELGRAFSTTDARITVLIERGLADRTYFVSVTVPRITNQTLHGVQQPRTRYMPADTQPMNEILPLVRDRLRPITPPRTPGNDQVTSRRALQGALNQHSVRGFRPTR